MIDHLLITVYAEILRDKEGVIRIAQSDRYRKYLILGEVACDLTGDIIDETEVEDVHIKPVVPQGVRKVVQRNRGHRRFHLVGDNQKHFSPFSE